MGHSIGEVAAAFVCHMYTLDECINLLFKLIESTQAGWMYHGSNLCSTPNVALASNNFLQNNENYVTVCGLQNDFENFKSQNNHFKKVHTTGAWHYPTNDATSLVEISSGSAKSYKFYSLTFGKFFDVLDDDYWKFWTTNCIDVIKHIKPLQNHSFNNIIEIGFHPVLKPMFQHVSYNCYIVTGNRNVETESRKINNDFT